MIRNLSACAVLLGLGACAVRYEPPRQVPIASAGVLPLQLSDDFRVEKVSVFSYDPREKSQVLPTQNQMILFERQRTVYGAITGLDRQERYGQYFNIWWHTKQPANLTVRFEYRQENLGSHVQAKELTYAAARGTTESKFTVIGDEYNEDGRVSAWRVLMIENGRIVGMRQSFLWN
jgi:hypothetical protein